MRSTSSAQVTLLTMHNAKGLEFPMVFLAGHGRGTVSALAGRIDFRDGARRRAAALLRGDDARARSG